MTTKKIRKSIHDEIVPSWTCPICADHRQLANDIGMINAAVMHKTESMRSKWSGYSNEDAEEVAQAWVRLLKRLGDYYE